MNSSNKKVVEGFRSASEVLRSYLDGLLTKVQDADTKAFIQEEIDSLDSQPDDSNSKLKLVVIRRNEQGKTPALYVDGLEKEYERYKFDIVKYVIALLLSGYNFHHGYGAERDKFGRPTAWYLYFE